MLRLKQMFISHTVSVVGFRELFRFIRSFHAGPADGCGGDIFITASNSTEIRATIHANQDCNWRIATPLGYTVQFQIIELHLPTTRDCSYNFIELRDGYVSLSSLITQICNNTAIGTTYTTSKRYGFLRLVTAGSLLESPFKIQISAVLCNYFPHK